MDNEGVPPPNFAVRSRFAFETEGCAQPAATPQFTSTDETTLRVLFDSVPAEILSGRWDAWAAHYATDAVLQPPNGAAVRGREVILTWGTSFPAVDSVTFTNVVVRGEGNMAYGTSDIALKFKDGNRDSGKQLDVFRRSPGGAWEIVAVSFNSDLPLPVAPAAKPR